MRKALFIPGIFSLVVAVIIFVFGTGLRVLYSGAFFIMLGILLIIRARRSA